MFKKQLIQILLKDNILSNHRDFILEKYYFFIIQILNVFFLLKNKNINKDEIKLISDTFQYILKNTLNIFLTFSLAMKYYKDFLKLYIYQFNNNIEPSTICKMFLNENNFLQNRYKSDNKYNFVITSIIKYYSL